MKIHHLNCATMCPVAAHWVTGAAGHLVCHCLLIETSNGLVLVDTAFGTEDILRTKERLPPGVGLLGPRFDLRETALEQVKALGFSATDVRHIVLTHLDLDHAGGLSDFPEAQVHVFARELEAATSPRRSLSERHRYRQAHWAHGPKWRTYTVGGGEKWFGFDAVRGLEGLPPEILMIPLAGHTHGHCGIAVQDEWGWFLHAGDAYFFHEEMAKIPRCTPGLRAFQRLVAVDNAARLANQARLRALAQDADAKVRVFCAHDATELARIRPGGAWTAL